MTFENRMKTAELLIKKGVTANKDARVKEYNDHIKQLEEEKKAKTAKKRGNK